MQKQREEVWEFYHLVYGTDNIIMSSQLLSTVNSCILC